MIIRRDEIQNPSRPTRIRNELAQLRRAVTIHRADVQDAFDIKRATSARYFHAYRDSIVSRKPDQFPELPGARLQLASPEEELDRTVPREQKPEILFTVRQAGDAITEVASSQPYF